MADRHPVKVIVEQGRDIISRHLPECESVVGLSKRSDDFRFKVSDAILRCVFTHMQIPYQKRKGSIRKDLARASRAARSAQNSLCSLANILNDLPSNFSDALSTHWGTLGEISRRSLARETEWLQLTSKVTGFYAEHLNVDKGGAPKMLAFNTLAKGLAVAFKSATGREAKVTWDPRDEQYSGKFLKLVEAVLPLASSLAKMPGRPLRIPSGKYSLGKYLYDLTRAPSGKRQHARAPM